MDRGVLKRTFGYRVRALTDLCTERTARPSWCCRLDREVGSDGRPLGASGSWLPVPVEGEARRCQRTAVSGPTIWTVRRQSGHSRERSTHPEIRDRLQSFVRDASPEQIRAWGDSIPPLQREVNEVLVRDVLARGYSAILEYELPLESRCPVVLLLVGDGVLVVELKGKLEPSQADIDQAAAYARDLRCYHRECWNRPVVAVLVPTRAKGYVRQVAGVHVAGPDALDALVSQLTGPQPGVSIDRERFLDESAYCPLPTLVESARELFNSGLPEAAGRRSSGASKTT